MCREHAVLSGDVLDIIFIVDSNRLVSLIHPSVKKLAVGKSHA